MREELSEVGNDRPAQTNNLDTSSGIFTVTFVGYFLFGKMFSPQDLAEISPAEKTVGIFELSIDGSSSQVQKFYEVMGKYPVYKKENIMALVETVLPVNFEKEFKIENLGVIFADSRVQPLRKGTIGIAVATAGFEPIEDLIGKPDLFNRPLQITKRAIADDLTSAAQFLLNEADQQTPVVIIRGANIEFTDNPQTTTEISMEDDLYLNIFSKQDE